MKDAPQVYCCKKLFQFFLSILSQKTMHWPSDVLTTICSFLRPTEICKLESVSKNFQATTVQDSVWQQWCTKIGANKTAPSTTTCKQLYKQKIQEEGKLITKICATKFDKVAPNQYRILSVPRNQWETMALPANGYTIQNRTVTAEAPWEYKLLDGILLHLNKTSPILIFGKERMLNPLGYEAKANDPEVIEGPWKPVTASLFGEELELICSSTPYNLGCLNNNAQEFYLQRSTIIDSQGKELVQDVATLLRPNARCYQGYHAVSTEELMLDRDEEFAIIDDDRVVLFVIYMRRCYG